MNLCAIIFVTLLLLIGDRSYVNCGKPAVEPNVRSYRISYIPNMVFYEKYMSTDKKKGYFVHLADDGWSWHFTTVLGDGNVKQNEVQELEKKRPKTLEERSKMSEEERSKLMSEEEYVSARRDLEQKILNTLKAEPYPPSGRSLFEEVQRVYKISRVYVDTQVILDAWKQEADIAKIKETLGLKDFEGDSASLDKAFISKMDEVLISRDLLMGLDEALEFLKTKFKMTRTDMKLVAEKLKLKSLVGQLYHEFNKAGSMSIKEFHTELVSLTDALGGVELTSPKDFITEDYRVMSNDLMIRINEHFKAASENELAESNIWRKVLANFYEKFPTKMPFKLKVQKLLPSLLYLDEVELNFEPHSQTIKEPQLEKKGKPGAKPAPPTEQKEIIYTGDPHSTELAFIPAEAELKSVKKFYELNRAEIEEMVKLAKVTELMAELKAKLITEDKLLKTVDADQELKNLLMKLKKKRDANENIVRKKSTNIDWNAEDDKDLKLVELKRTELQAAKLKKALEKYETDGGNEEEEKPGPKKKGPKELKIKTEDEYKQVMAEHDSFETKINNLKEELKQMEKVASEERAKPKVTVDRVTELIPSQGGHEALVQVDSAYNDGTGAKAGKGDEAGPSFEEDC